MLSSYYFSCVGGLVTLAWYNAAIRIDLTKIVGMKMNNACSVKIDQPNNRRNPPSPERKVRQQDRKSPNQLNTQGLKRAFICFNDKYQHQASGWGSWDLVKWLFRFQSIPVVLRIDYPSYTTNKRDRLAPYSGCRTYTTSSHALYVPFKPDRG